MLEKAFKWIFIMLAATLVVIAVLAVIDWRMESTPVIMRAETPAPSPSFTPTPSQSPTPTPTPSPSPTATPSPTPLSDEARVSLYMQTMSLEEKLGQLVIFGFTGSSAPSSEFSSLFSEYGIGNFMLYGQNIQKDDGDGGFGRAGRLTDALCGAVEDGVTPLIGIDVEGGSVVRFRWDEWPSSARTLGKSGDTERAREQFASIGRALLDCGVNLDLAPVLDISENPMSTFLTTRIISSDAETAAAIGAACIEGLHEAGCLSVAKHFPGHGGTAADSHSYTPVIDRSLEDMLGYDLIPFAAGVEAGADVMLVAHIYYPQLDATDIASMSYPIITELLRERLGFSGVVMSDDFRMAGLTSRYSAADAAVRFLLAGGDLILCGARADTQRTIMNALYAATADGRLSEERIDESVQRVLLLKLQGRFWTPDSSA